MIEILNFREVIKSEMDRQELSTKELARRSGVSRDSLWCWLNGSSPKISSLELVLDALDLELLIVEKE